jgi:transposase InsO family protein
MTKTSLRHSRTRKTSDLSNNSGSPIRRPEQQESSLPASPIRQETSRSPTLSGTQRSEEPEEGSRKDQLNELREGMQRLETAIREIQMSNIRQAESSEIESMSNEEESRPTSQYRSQESQVSSHAANSVAKSVHELDMTKELFKLVPNYDGSGGPSKLLDYVEKFQKYADVAGDDITSSVELTLATAKLTGDANLWWREHCATKSIDDLKRIRTWDQLKKALFETFAPPEHRMVIREKLKNIKQKGTVIEYTAAFRRLTMQLPEISFEEAEFAYLQGLSPRIRDLIRTKDGITDIRTLQNACIRLDTQEREKRNPDHTNALTIQTIPSSSSSSPSYRTQHYQGRGTSFRGRGVFNSHKRAQGSRPLSQNNKSFRAAPYRLSQSRDPARVSCDLCDDFGHFMRNCPKLREAKAAIQSKASVAVGEYATVIDSGASQHMFNSAEVFEDMLPRKLNVSCANAQEIEATHEGFVDLQFGDNLAMRLQNALYVPKLNHNLLSVRALNKEGHDVVFRRNGSVVLTDNDSSSSYTIGHAIGNLYYVTPEAIQSNLAASTEDPYTIWHHRLGHPHAKVLQSISKYVTGIDNLTPSTKLCEGCILAKSHRLPFPKAAENRANDILDRIHSDLCGPMPIPSLIGSRYVLTLIDDTSRFAHVYFLAHKNETFETFCRYRALVEKQTGKPIKCLRSDGGGEYVNQEMREYLSRNGIRHETTTADTPQQNGVAERYNRTLLETVRALMLSAGIPKDLWAEISATAAYLRNRLPNRANKNKSTPYELWYGKKPNVKDLRVIWADAFMHIPKHKRSKLEPRATKLKLLGYHDYHDHEEKRAYKLWNTDQKKIEISRDVIFDETPVLHYAPVVQEPDEFVVDSIIGERSTDGKTEYLVKWAGYDDNDNTWEPFEHVADTEALDMWEQRQRLQQANITETETPDQPTNDDISDEPKTYADAISSPEAHYWREAIQMELVSIDKNGTWTYVERSQVPPQRRPIGSKWVFKRKLNPDGSINRYKARLVAKGYAQQHGIDYDETFAPVARLTSIRVLLSIGALLDLEIHQMDVKSAFLNGDLDEEVFMEVPEGIEGIGTDKVCRLLRSLYGLKQSPRCWYQKLNTFLSEQGFTRLQSDHAVYIRQTRSSLVILAMHVDDLMILTDSKEGMVNIKQALSSAFEMTDCGEIHFYLGIQIRRNRQNKQITLSQSSFAEQIIRRFRMENAKPVGTPLDPSVKLTQATEAEPISTSRTTYFRQIIGSLMYLMIATRPDIAAAISIISQFAARPTEAHLAAAKRVLRYIKGTVNYGLYQGMEPSDGQDSDKARPQLYGYSDANWGNDLDTRKSTSGYIFYLSYGPISWASKRQSTIALSSTEAEYMALTQAVKEAIWLRRLLHELGFEAQVSGPTKIFEDNQSSIAIAKNPIHHSRTKHIDIQHHFVRDKVETMEIELQYLSTEEMIADALTKPVPRPKFAKLVDKMQLRPTAQ